MKKLYAAFWLLLGRLADAYSVLGIQGTSVLLSAIAGGAYAGWATDWLAAWGPIAWLGCGLATAILLLLILQLYENVSAKRLVRQMALVASSTSHVNVMENHFRDQRLRLSDFFHPFHLPHVGKTFNNCEIIGPGNLYLLGGGTVTGTGFINCQFVVLKPDDAAGGRVVKGVTAFQNCHFIGGRFVQCTFFVLPDMLPELRRGIRGHGLDVITFEPPEPPAQPAAPAGPP